jgi:hypothetical protein
LATDSATYDRSQGRQERRGVPVLLGRPKSTGRGMLPIPRVCVRRDTRKSEERSWRIRSSLATGRSGIFHCFWFERWSRRTKGLDSRERDPRHHLNDGNTIPRLGFGAFQVKRRRTRGAGMGRVGRGQPPLRRPPALPDPHRTLALPQGRGSGARCASRLACPPREPGNSRNASVSSGADHLTKRFLPLPVPRVIPYGLTYDFPEMVP